MGATSITGAGPGDSHGKYKRKNNYNSYIPPKCAKDTGATLGNDDSVILKQPILVATYTPVPVVPEVEEVEDDSCDVATPKRTCYTRVKSGNTVVYKTGSASSIKAC